MWVGRSGVIGMVLTAGIYCKIYFVTETEKASFLAKTFCIAREYIFNSLPILAYRKVKYNTFGCLLWDQKQLSNVWLCKMMLVRINVDF